MINLLSKYGHCYNSWLLTIKKFSSDKSYEKPENKQSMKPAASLSSGLLSLIIG